MPVICDALAQAICARAASGRVGDGFDPEAMFGPIQNRPQFDRLNAGWDQIQRPVEDRGRVRGGPN